MKRMKEFTIYYRVTADLEKTVQVATRRDAEEEADKIFRAEESRGLAVDDVEIVEVDKD